MALPSRATTAVRRCTKPREYRLMTVPDPADELAELRRQIDALDRQLHQLLNRRARCALAVAGVKQAAAGAGQAPAFYRPEREAQVLRQAAERNGGPLSDATVVRLFREVISACMALEQRLRVAYVGDRNGRALQALLQHFGHAVAAQVCRDPAAALDTLRHQQTDYVLLAVTELLALAGDGALDQRFAAGVSAAGEVSGGDRTEERFIVLGRQPVGPSGVDKTALLAPAGQPRLAAEQWRLQTRDTAFIELAGHQQDSAVRDSLAGLGRYRLLGSYPAAVG